MNYNPEYATDQIMGWFSSRVDSVARFSEQLCAVGSGDDLVLIESTPVFGDRWLRTQISRPVLLNGDLSTAALSQITHMNSQYLFGSLSLMDLDRSDLNVEFSYSFIFFEDVLPMAEVMVQVVAQTATGAGNELQSRFGGRLFVAS